MFKLKKICIMFIFFIFTIFSIFSKSYATSVKVTDENLKSSLQNFASSDDNDQKYNITVENGQIKIALDKANYTLNYDLTNKPTFTYETEITQGMSYNDFKVKTDGSSSTMIAYAAVANIQGVEYEDSLAYFAMSLLEKAFSDTSSNNLSNAYVIVDDTQDGVTLEKDPNDTKTIYVSEFENKVMEYVNSMYAEKQTIKDTDGFNTYEMTTERKDVTDTSCKLVTTLSVDTDADFSKIKGYAEQLGNSSTDKDNDETNNTNDNNNIISNDISNKTDSTNNNVDITLSESTKDNTSSKTTLPKTGTINKMVLITVISICSIFAIVFKIKNKKYKDVI